MQYKKTVLFSIATHSYYAYRKITAFWRATETVLKRFNCVKQWGK